MNNKKNWIFFAQNMWTKKWLKTIWDTWYQKKTDKWIVSQLAQQTAFLKPLRTEEMDTTIIIIINISPCQWWWSSITTPSLLGQQIFVIFQKMVAELLISASSSLSLFLVGCATFHEHWYWLWQRSKSLEWEKEVDESVGHWLDWSVDPLGSHSHSF